MLPKSRLGDQQFQWMVSDLPKALFQSPQYKDLIQTNGGKHIPLYFSVCLFSANFAATFF